jgi:two-component system, chemotaxis family, sensor histidine kinase and response regulator PixL
MMRLPKKGKAPLLVIANDTEAIAIPIEGVVLEQELVIKPFGSAVAMPAYLLGCTILGDGNLALVLDGQALIDQHQTIELPPPRRKVEEALWDEEAADLPPDGSSAVQPYLAESSDRFKVAMPPTILVVDDSLTTRQSLILTLTKGGYRTVQAKDGKEAIAVLQQTPDVKAVFCDVEMPVMNGFEFLNQCRQTFAKEVLPVIMLTSRNSDKHRQVANYMGATDYLTKPYLEQELLQVLKRNLT